MRLGCEELEGGRDVFRMVAVSCVYDSILYYMAWYVFCMVTVVELYVHGYGTVCMVIIIL